MNALISELKSEALKERHWERLTRELRVSWNPNELTLGQVWEIDLIRHESVIRQLLLVAQGELALELFLKQVKEYWQTYTVNLVNYQNKTMLIRGWDELFNKLKEHINSLAAMKLSPYYVNDTYLLFRHYIMNRVRIPRLKLESRSLSEVIVFDCHSENS